MEGSRPRAFTRRQQRRQHTLPAIASPAATALYSAPQRARWTASPRSSPLPSESGPKRCHRPPDGAINRCRMETSRDATALLHSSRAGDRRALDELFTLTYDELKRVARYRLGRMRAGETLSTTALVHEAYVRLVDQSRVQWVDRAHFLAIAARAMLFVLIDHLRARAALKRGALEDPVPIEDIQVAETG